jgi:hypothetical protein
MSSLEVGSRSVSRTFLPGSRERSRYVIKYLTPHKVLLLILIHAYCHASIPPRYQASVFKFLLDQIEVYCPMFKTADDFVDTYGTGSFSGEHTTETLYDTELCRPSKFV